MVTIYSTKLLLILLLLYQTGTSIVLSYFYLLFAVVSLLVSEDGESVTRERLGAIVSACDVRPPLIDLDDLFSDPDRKACSVDQFESWILKNPDLASFTEWLLGDGSSEDEQGLQLEALPDPPTFYQTLAKRFQSMISVLC